VRSSTLPNVCILDYGSGNLRSAQRALERVGAEVTVTSDPAAARDADGLVVPGVGAYEACMAGLDAVGGARLVLDRLAADRPVLGICVGMQVMFAEGVEHGVHTRGIGALAGRVTPLHAPVVPHMGWNTVDVPVGSRLFDGLDADTRFYFVHSYGATETDGLVTTCEHGERFVAAVEYGSLSATQFHPEKSGDAGATLLENWIKSL
jgi:glutamine amidotransferase